MTEEAAGPRAEMDEILARLEDAKEDLTRAIEEADPERFQRRNVDGDSLKRVLERAADDLNFYYGHLVARALSLPPPPCTQAADFLSLHEAKMALQVAHRRFTNYLHDLQPSDLERTARDQEHGTYTLRQLLEMAAAHYRLRAQQVRTLGRPRKGGRR